MEKSTTSSVERKVQTYLKPRYHDFVCMYATAEEMSQSEAIKTMVKSFYDNMTDSERQAIAQRAQRVCNTSPAR